MTNGKDITPLSITDGKISNQAKIKPAKLAPGAEAQVLIAQSDGKFAPKTISGDARLRANGLIELTNNALAAAKVTEADLNAAGGITESDYGKETVLVSNQQGRPEQKTADEFREFLEVERGAAKNQSTIDAGSITASVTSVISEPTGLNANQTAVAGTTQSVPMEVVTASATAGSSGATDYIIEHNFGSKPVSVQVSEDDGNGNFEEIEADVVSTSTQTTIKFSKSNVGFTAKIIGLKS